MDKNPKLQQPLVVPQDELKKQLVQEVLGQLRQQETSILKRNREIDLRYDYLYSDGLSRGLPIKKNFDDTQFNFVRLVPEIMTNQLFGRGFNVSTTYNKEDLAPFDIPGNDPQEQQTLKTQAMQLNGRRKVDADLRALTLRSVLEDNDGVAFLNRAGKQQSFAGHVTIKHWLDTDEKKYKMVVLENPNNFWRAWSNSNFREWDWSAYLNQISENKARRDYSEYLPEGESFATSRPGGPVWRQAAGEDVNNLPQTMVWVIDLVGYVPGYSADDKGNLKKVKPGDETEMNLLIVGNHLCHVRTKNLPQFEVINNLEEPQNPWGVSDVSKDALSINKTIVQIARSWITLGIKSLFPKYKYKGFTSLNIPQSSDMEVSGFPMDQDQDIDLITQPQTFEEFHRIIEWLTEAFVRVTRIGMVMFNDPTAVSNSNQAMMTGMKPLTDVIEEKQARWTNAFVNIFERALSEIAAANIDKGLTAAINDDPGYKVRIEWPSILRKEDAAYQTLWMNLFNAGALSWSTFIDKVGPQDTSEELDRMRDDLNDPVRAAMVSHSLPELAHFTINKSAGIPPWGYIVPKVQLRGDLTPQQEANMANNYGWNDGPFGSSLGPQGFEGSQANQDFINAGQVTPAPTDNPMPTNAQASPGVPANPVATPGQNAPGTQPVSQPGSGAPAVTPQGKINMTNQRRGK